MLFNGIVIPITAFLLERFTTRQLYIACMSFFTIGTFICAIAPEFYTILIGRVVQAVGAGILMPLITNVIFTLFPPHKRGAAMGTLGMVLLPGGILMGLMSPITGRLFDKIGAKWLSVTGLVITVITTYALTDLDTETSFGYVTGVYTARMFGMALLMMPILQPAWPFSSQS